MLLIFHKLLQLIPLWFPVLEEEIAEVVPWIDFDVVIQGEHLFVDGFDEVFFVAEGEVGATDAVREYCVTRHQAVAWRDVQHDAAWGMSGSVNDFDGILAHGKHIPVFDILIDT